MMTLEDMLLREISQAQKDKCCIINEVVNFTGTEGGMFVIRDWGEKEGRVRVLNVYRSSILQNEKKGGGRVMEG